MALRLTSNAQHVVGTAMNLYLQTSAFHHNGLAPRSPPVASSFSTSLVYFAPFLSLKFLTIYYPVMIIDRYLLSLD